MAIGYELISQEKKKNKMVFLLKGITYAYANALRRLMVAEVPTMAIEDLEIRENSSVLYDEMVGLRLGLIPLTTDLKAYNLTSECTCKGSGCARCQLKLTLKSVGPKTVYSSEIKTKDPKVKPVSDKFPITKLLEDQSIVLEATATLGIGKEHAKWSPGLIFYRYQPKVIIQKQPSNPQLYVDVCPWNIFEVKGGKLQLNKKTHDDCTLCNACVDASKNEEVKAEPVEGNFIFTIESWGQLSPDKIVKKALNVFDAKLKDMKKQLK